MQRVFTTSCSSRFCGQTLCKKDMQRLDQFLKSRLSVTLTVMESKFRSPITPTFGWFCPEAPIAAWMGYDTRIRTPRSLEEVDCGSMQETDADQPTIESRPQCVLPSEKERVLSQRQNLHDHLERQTWRAFLR